MFTKDLSSSAVISDVFDENAGVSQQIIVREVVSSVSAVLRVETGADATCPTWNGVELARRFLNASVRRSAVSMQMLTVVERTPNGFRHGRDWQNE